MGRLRHSAFLACVLVATGIVAVGPAAVGQEPSPGPANLGFEDDTDDLRAPGWDITSNTDGATIVDEETGADSPSYVEPPVTVTPVEGDHMLRLGTPKQVAETQSPGPTTVTQTFRPVGTRLAVAARIFSWEFRRNDRVVITATGASLSGETSFFGIPCTSSTTGVSCVVTPSTRKGVLGDTGWQTLSLVTSTSQDVTLTYTVEGTSNSSHATWAYMDAVAAGQDARLVYEGSLVQLRDLVGDTALPAGITAWDWTVTLPDATTLGSTAAEPSFFPPQDGTYVVDLTVQHPDGPTTISRSLGVTNAPALVNALDVEALEGADAPVLARFLDAGWQDTHEVSVLGAGGATTTSAGVPALLRGRIEATVPATAADGSEVRVTVDDVDEDTLDDEPAAGSTDTATVTRVSPTDTMRHEDADDSLAAPPSVVADVSRLSWIQEEGDVDVVELGLAGGALVPGTEVVVALDEVPADYDLVVLASRPQAPETAPYQMAPYQMAPYQMAPYQMAPYQMAPYQMAPIEQAPYQMAPYQMAPYQMAELGLSPYQMAPYQMAPYQMAPLSTDDTVTWPRGTGGGDIDASELGIESLLTSVTSEGDGVQVAGFSANRGPDARESVLVRVDQPGTRLFAVVVGADGAHDGVTPYRMRLESSAPFGALASADEVYRTALRAVVCAPRSVGQAGRPGVAYTPPTNPDTVIVTSLGRLPAATETEWQAFVDGLGDYAEAVGGVIVDVPPTAYAGWDADPCSVDAANGVTDTIRDLVQPVLAAGARYLVVVGDDDVVPFRRTSSGVVIGDEAQYLAGSFLQAGSPLAAALAASQELTDDFYADLEPEAFQTGELYVPDVATGRLVETPAEIAGQMTAYLASPGLDAGTAMVAAHDFLRDGGEAIATTLGAESTLLTEDWSAAALRCAWLGQGTGCTEPGVVSPNSHWTHYASLSALGYTTSDFGNIVTSQEVAQDPRTATQLVFTIGCHAGFNVPDAQSLDGTAQGIDPALDFAQAMAQRQAVFVASTGFGLGDTEGLAGTERLMADFAEQLLVDGVTAGEALRAAKQAYADALSTVSTYDVKSLVQQTLYGIPHYQIVGAGPATPTAQASSLDAPSVAATGSTVPHAFDLQEVADPDTQGRYWAVGGDPANVQVTPGRPWQPRYAEPVPAGTRGALVRGGAFTAVADVLPVVTRPTVEWETDPDASLLADQCRDSWWPADLTTVRDDALVVVPGQFRCESATPGLGTQRLYHSLDLEVLGATTAYPEDWTQPSAGPLTLRSVGGGIEVSLPASDASGIARIVPVVIDPATGRVTSVSVVPADPASTAPFVVQLPGVTSAQELLVQVVDGANNVTTLTGRGANLRYLDVQASASMLTAPTGAVTFTATLSGWSGLTGPVSYRWDFGDGSTESGLVTSSTFTTQHAYPDPWTARTATLRVWDAGGATGTVDVHVSTCDPLGDVPAGAGWADIVGCGVTLDGSTATFTLRLAEPASASGSYRVEITTGSGRKATTTKLRYDHANASYSGARSLVAGVEDEGRSVVYRVAVSDLGVRNLTTLDWMAEVQSGLPGEPTAGFVDRMPDAGLLRWTAS